MRRHLAWAALLGIAVIIAASTVVSAADSSPLSTNADCLECHDVTLEGPAFSKVDFSVGAVDRETACIKCHWEPAGAHPFHNVGITCGGNCHPGWGIQLVSAIPAVPTDSGWFFSAESPNADSDTIHLIHSRPRWPASVEKNGRQCSSCHASAACSACHEPPVAHGDHTYDPDTETRSAESWVGVVCYGTDVGDEYTLTAGLEEITCAASACHNTSAPSPPVFVDDRDGAMAFTGTWRTAWDWGSYLGGTAHYSGYVNARATVSVEGSEFSWIGSRGPNFGFARVWIDGVLNATVDCYASTRSDAIVVYSAPLEPGVHTLEIEVTGTNRIGALGDQVWVDGIEVAGASYEFVPDCASCHSDKTAPHGYETDVHEAGVATNIDGGGKTCISCHDMDLITEHEKATSDSAGGSCVTCHPMPRDAFDVWDDSGDSCSACHATGGGAPVAHEASDTAHTPVQIDAAAMCSECHGTDFTIIHADAKKNGDEDRTSCNVCHTQTYYPESDDCTVCHTTFDAHVYDLVLHTSTWTLDGCITPDCHGGNELITEHTRADATFECVTCHDNDTDSAYGDAIAAGDKACDACHEGVTQAASHRDQHPAVPPLMDAAGDPHYSYYDGSAGGVPTSDCSNSCHLSNLVDEHLGIPGVTTGRQDVTGADLDCDSCHDSDDPAVISAIDSDPPRTNCDACHSVHGPMGAVHESSYVDSPAVPCGGNCHGSFIDNLHEGIVVEPNGRTLSGCELCHGYYEGERGEEIQWAIEVAEDTRCSACHTPFHVDTSAAHSASDQASLDCGACHDGIVEDAIDVTAMHSGVTAPGACAVCHDNPSRVPNITLEEPECASCHATEGTDYHGLKDELHTYTGVDCTGSDCHDGADLPTLHEPALLDDDVSHYVDTCALCHLNEGDRRAGEPPIDWGTATSNCASCHIGHGDLGILHTAVASGDCVRCHEPPDVRVLHADRTEGACAVCHDNPSRIPEIILETPECANCHVIEGTDYHGLKDDLHTYIGTDCTGSGCHGTDLPTLHEPYLWRYPAYADTCALCHLNADPERIDWLTASAECARCHEGHGDLNEIHTTSESGACLACHKDKTPDVRAIHAADPADSCVVCHNATYTLPTDPDPEAPKNTECAKCHANEGTDYHSEAGTAHYYADGATCVGAGCHASQSLPEAHEPYLWRYPAYADTCALCHLNADPERIDWLTASAECARCHEGHGDPLAAHVSEQVDCEECHDISDVSAVHSGLPDGGCSACHSPVVIPVTTNCSVCHTGVSGDHYLAHDASGVIPPGCGGCHFTNLVDEHRVLGMGCATCHESVDQLVKDAIADEQLACVECHPDRHKGMNGEFNPNNGSMHRVDDSLPGMRTSFEVNGSTYTWSLPSSSYMFKSGSGLTFDSMVACDECHTFDSNPAGPHGATVQVNIDPAYPRPYDQAFLWEDDSPGFSSDTICAKCHTLGNGDNWGNRVHDKHARTEDGDRLPSTHRQGPGCVTCHVRIPHGWARPRLIGYQTDPAPYATDQTYGIQELALRNYTPSDWDKEDCQAECGREDKHRDSVRGSVWPGTVPAPPDVGTLSGRVVDDDGFGLVGAIVNVSSGPSTLTVSYGYYTISGIDVGSYSVTASRSGYIAQTESVTIQKDETTTRDFVLSIAPVTEGTVSGTVTDAADTNKVVSGASVSLFGGPSATTAFDGTYMLSGVSAGTYTMTVTASGYETWTGLVTVDADQTTTQDVSLTPIPVGDGNLAYGKRFYASDYEGSTYSPNKAGDGSTSTFWWSDDRGDDDDREYLWVDLGQRYRIDTVEIVWYGQYWAEDFKVQASTDGRRWRTVKEVDDRETGGTYTATFSDRDARYVRIECQKTNDSRDWGYGIAELRVFE